LFQNSGVVKAAEHYLFLPSKYLTVMSDKLHGTCNAFPACQHPYCGCRSGNGRIGNQFKDKVDIIARDLHRVTVALNQFKDDLKEVELENHILRAGVEDLIRKYTTVGVECPSMRGKLVCSTIINDLGNIVRISQQSSSDILSKVS
jgi:hypothetical protein